MSTSIILPFVLQADDPFCTEAYVNTVDEDKPVNWENEHFVVSVCAGMS
jgi:hypothetical protein